MTHIQLEDIVKVFGSGSKESAVAVDRVSLHVEPGEFFFLLGPSGCGKTTLLRIIAGLTHPTDGLVIFDDRDVTRLAVEQRNTALVFQNYALWPHMTVRQNVEFGPRMQGAPAATRRQQAADNLTRVEMGDYAARKPNQLSGGQQQRVALARALAAQPDCLLLDEPLSNLDARLRLHMRHELRQLVKSTGTTAVYVTHDQKEALSMADRIAVMDAGKVIQTGRPEEVYNKPATKFVADFLGEANFTPGKIAAPSPQGTATATAAVRVETSVGDLLAADPAGRGPGSNVLCCVRPERIKLSPEPIQANTSLAAIKATVTESVYLGEMRQYFCALPGREQWKVSVLAGSETPVPPGTTVTLQIAPQDVAILPA